MPQGQFNHFTNLCHLLAATSHIIVSHIVHLFLVFALDGISLAMNHRVGGDDTVGTGVGFNHLEFDGMHSLTYQKQITLLDGPVGFHKVRLEVDIKQIARDTFNGIIERQNMNALAVRYITTRRHRHDITQTHPQILADAFVHADGSVVAFLVGQDDADRVFALFAFNEDRVASEEFEFFHLGGGQRNDGIVIVGGVVDDEAVGGALFEGCCGSVEEWVR